jgi:hypothetical protein
LTADDVKVFFDWIEVNFKGSIKAHSALSNYWRTLKRLHYEKVRKYMDEIMRQDCVNVDDGSEATINVRYHKLTWECIDNT